MVSLNENLNGIICMNKPVEFTSFDVIAKLRGVLRVKRLGHAGTLDPMATGVLPIFVGRATKACDILPDHDKLYEAQFQLGLTSDTQDIYGAVTAKHTVPELSEEDFEAALDKFRGDIMQLPPMYSAVMINGQRLYDLARQGIEVERAPRPVSIYELSLISYDKATHTGKMKISCSRGTYIRTLINDIGDALGCGAIMTDLVRTRACGFTLDDCTDFAQLQELSDMGVSAEKYLVPIEKVFEYLPVINLSEKQERLYRNGIKLDIDRMDFACPDENGSKFRVHGCDGSFIGTCYADLETRELRVDKNF